MASKYRRIDSFCTPAGANIDLTVTVPVTKPKKQRRKAPDPKITFLDLQGNRVRLCHGMTVTIDDPSDRQRRYNVFRSPSSTDRHLYLECLEVSPEPIDGVHLRCKYRQRQKRLRLDPDSGSHTCDFTVRESLQNFISTDPETRFSHRLAYLCGRLNMSLANAVSPEMRQFAQHIFQLGQANPHGNFDNIIKWPTRYEVRTSLVSVGLRETQEIVSHFRQSSYVSVAIDEGSTLGTKYVHMILHDVHRAMGEYCLSSQVLHGTGTAEDYVEALLSGFVELNQHEVSVGTVVVDGGTAQLKALGPKPNMLRSKLPRRGHLGEMRRYLIFPCVCHKLNNCYKALCENCAEFGKFAQQLRSLADELKSQQSDVRCPQFVSTRWLYDASILKFLEEHKEQVTGVLTEKRVKDVYDDIDIWKSLIYMMRSLVDQLESSNAPAADVWPKIYTLASDLRRTGSKNEKKVRFVYHQLAEKLEKEILLNGTYIIAFMLTPLGRDWFRYPEGWRVKPVVNTYTFHEKLKRVADDVEDNAQIIDEIVDPKRVMSVLFPEPAESAPVVADQRTGSVLADGSSDDWLEEEEEEAYEEEETYEEESDQEHQYSDIPEDETTDGAKPQLKPGQWKTAALNEWKRMAQIVFGERDDSKTRMSRAYVQLNTYLSTSTMTSFEKKLCQIMDVNLWNWENLASDDEFAEIAEIALRIRPTPASEASAERYISLQRLVILARRNRANKDLTDARMALLRRPNRPADAYVPINVAENRKRVQIGKYRIPR